MRILLVVSRTSDAKLGAEFARDSLQGIARINSDLVKRGIVPPLYKSGVVYKRESRNRETFVDALVTLRKGHGDCAHLAAWRVGELWAAGEKKADIRLHWREYDDGHRLYHVTIRRGDGRIEDPSRLLHMQ